jgi:hypothetical protein
LRVLGTAVVVALAGHVCRCDAIGVGCLGGASSVARVSAAMR